MAANRRSVALRFGPELSDMIGKHLYLNSALTRPLQGIEEGRGRLVLHQNEELDMNEVLCPIDRVGHCLDRTLVALDQLS